MIISYTALVTAVCHSQCEIGERFMSGLKAGAFSLLLIQPFPCKNRIVKRKGASLHRFQEHPYVLRSQSIKTSSSEIGITAKGLYQQKRESPGFLNRG